MTLSRLVRALDAKHHVSVRWVSKVYILVDIACLVLQVMGTVMAAYGDDDQKKNSMYYISGGLIFQLLAFVVFMGLVAKLHRHLQLQPTDVAQERRIHWRRVVWALYASSALVLVRNLVRVVEFLQGSDGEVISNEVYLYVFDAVPMTIVVLVLAACHPGWLFRAARKVCEGAVLDSAQVPLTMEDQASRK